MELTRAQAIDELWRRGVLRYKLREHQKPVYRMVADGKSLKSVLNVSRRFGKTFCLVLHAFEVALRKPDAQVRFAAPTRLALKTYVHPIVRTLCEDCPDDIAPVWREMDGYYAFPNGSRIYMAGTDKGNAERLRGPASDLCLVDEAGSCDELHYLVHDILMPQLLTTGGRLVISSTPPKTPAHDYHELAMDAEKRGNYVKLTVDDNKSISPELRELYCEESGGPESTTWRREYLCEFVVDEETAVIPEFNEQRALKIVVPIELAGYFLPIVAMDVGFEDLTFVVFGYYDFRRAKLVVQDELVIKRMTTEQLAAAVKAKELALWGKKEVFTRVSDTNLILIHDLAQIHKLPFSPTLKDDKEAQVNQLRMWIKNEKVEIDPQCRELVYHLKTAVWNRTRTQFDRSKTAGHFDGVDALIYMLRNAPISINPYPAIPDGTDIANTWLVPSRHISDNARAIESMFSRKAR